MDQRNQIMILKRRVDDVNVAKLKSSVMAQTQVLPMDLMNLVLEYHGDGLECNPQKHHWELRDRARAHVPERKGTAHQPNGHQWFVP